MANKRIELEQYKNFVNLLEEDPNRKMVRRGVIMCAVAMMLFVVAMFVLGAMSTDLAKNPRNILEKPPAPTPETPSQEGQIPGQGIPGQTPIQIPEQSPGQQTPIQIPEQTPGQQTPIQIPEQSPSPVPGGKAPAGAMLAMNDSCEGRMPEGTRAGDLLAQVETTVPGTEAPPAEISVPGTTPEGTTPGTAPSTAPQKPPLPQENKGVGSLSKLTNGAGGRGFQIYLLVLMVALVILLYLATRRVRPEAKGK